MDSTLNPRGEPVVIYYNPLDWYQGRKPLGWDHPTRQWWKPISKAEVIGLWCFIVFWVCDWTYTGYLLLTGRLCLL